MAPKTVCPPTATRGAASKQRRERRSNQQSSTPPPAADTHHPSSSSCNGDNGSDLKRLESKRTTGSNVSAKLMMKSTEICTQRYRRASRRALFFFCLVCCITFWGTAGEMEAKWTPNPDDDGPLPLSQAQRQQLLQLEETIVSSPDPQSTLNQVAEANGMDPQELVRMLQRNRRDLEGAGGTGATRRVVNSWPKKVIKLLGSIGVLMAHAFQRNPKLFSLLATTAMLFLFVSFSAPRTGVVLSSGRSLFSKGHTTVWSPPQKYTASYMESPAFERKPISLSAKGKFSLDELPRFLEKDGVEWHKLNRKSELAQAVTAQRTISVDSFIPEEEEEEEAEDDEQGTSRRAQALDLIYDAAATVLASRRLTEFVDDKSVIFHSSTEGRQRPGILVVKKMGDWGRYGLQPIKMSHQLEGETQTSLIYSTLKGGHFDGQIHLVISQRKGEAVCIHVRAVVPKKGRKLNKALAINITKAIAQSIEKSVVTQAKQTLARRSQGKEYRGKVHSRATERRQKRSENEKKQEEMAHDRRRKWQRQNPDSGRYRPSGERMRSPNFTK